MTIYNWQQTDWPHFRYDVSHVQKSLLVISEKMGIIQGKLSYLADNLQTEALLDIMIEEAVKTAEIEGEFVSRLDVRSSIKNKLGLNPEKIRVHDKRAQGIAELIIDVRNSFAESLSKEKLFDWHFLLFSRSSHAQFNIGNWRIDDEPMQIVSGHHNHWIVHFEAPPSRIVSKEMTKFIKWFNQTAPRAKKEIHFAAVRAAITHLYFESIHPFEDGNGRIGRALAEKALSQGFGYPVMLSLSHAIEAEKKAYYAALNAASKSNEITAWIEYFLDVILLAQIEVEKKINFILKKSMFFDKFQNILNDRQLKVIKRMLQEGVKGFEGGMSAKKYMIIADTSKATATRDLQELVSLNIFKLLGSGRSVRYELTL